VTSFDVMAETTLSTQATKSANARETNGTLDDRSAAICRTAAEVICEKGFNAASMNDIAAAANLTKAGLYYYTTGKQDLLYRIIDFAMSTVEREVIDVCRGIKDPQERLEQIIRRHVELVTDGGEAISILSDEVNCLRKPQKRQIIERKRCYLELVRQTLRELQAQGRLRNLRPEIATFNMFATILGMPRWYRNDGKLNAQEIADEIVAFLRGALLRE
jgi:AcrR family transcriptional regulator